MIKKWGEHYRSLATGQNLFGFSSHNFLLAVRRFLLAHQEANVKDVSLKSFRARKATELDREGHSLGKISAIWRVAFVSVSTLRRR
jgi:hypothetical protein